MVGADPPLEASLVVQDQQGDPVGVGEVVCPGGPSDALEDMREAGYS